MNTELTLVGLSTMFALVASGAALFVTMKVNSGLAKFEVRLIKDLEDRFMKVKDCAAYEGMRKEMEASYRLTTKGEIEGIQVQVTKDKDDLNIQLKGILAAIQSARNEKPRR